VLESMTTPIADARRRIQGRGGTAQLWWVRAGRVRQSERQAGDDTVAATEDAPSTLIKCGSDAQAFFSCPSAGTNSLVCWSVRWRQWAVIKSEVVSDSRVKARAKCRCYSAADEVHRGSLGQLLTWCAAECSLQRTNDLGTASKIGQR
jgi:hypothetical protein